MNDYIRKIGALAVMAMVLSATAMTAAAQQRAVSLTFDDLPGTHGDRVELEEVNRKLLATLTAERIPAIGFVNEEKLYRDGEEDPRLTSLLEDWLESGMKLGNHTWSHVSIDRVPVEAYQQEVMRGERITRPLIERYGGQLNYFRHTQLRTGPTESYRRRLNAFLDEKGYTVAPVTIDNDEYIYAYCYSEASAREDEKSMAWLQQEYLDYMRSVFSYYEDLSEDYLGYQPRQILLLHANLLNADVLGELVAMIRGRGYRFVSLDEALEDPAYGRPVVQSDRGLSWIHRWMLADGMRPPEQPAPGEEVMELFRTYRAGE